VVKRKSANMCVGRPNDDTTSLYNVLHSMQSTWWVDRPYALQITKLKIDSNPFAKGFRDSARLGDIERYLNMTFEYFCCGLVVHIIIISDFCVIIKLTSILMGAKRHLSHSCPSTRSRVSRKIIGWEGHWRRQLLGTCPLDC